MTATIMPAREFVDRAAALVRRRTGLVFSSQRRPALERGLEAARKRAGVTDPEGYLARLDAEPGLLDDLVADITVGETYFFREPEQFAVLRQQVFPEALARRPKTQPLRIWSAGCASGEEPYSVAVLLNQLGALPAAHILGTDISRAALARARKARYTRWSLRGVPDDVVRACFTRQGAEFVLTGAVQSAVQFGYLNLAEDAYPSLATGVWGMDLILCRNVLIYFDRETVAAVVQRLFSSLAHGGWLLLGASDPTLVGLVPVEVVVTRAGLAYRRTDHATQQAPAAGARTAPGPDTARQPLAHVEPPAPAPPEPPATPGPPSSEALRCYAARDYVTAARLASHVLTQDASDPSLWAVWVRALANQGDLVLAGRASAAGVERHPTSAELAYLHALLLAEGGRPADAAAAARAALYLDRHLVVAHLALGTALGRLGDAAGARRAFRNADRLLAARPADEVVPASDGEPAGRLAEMVRLQLQLLPAADPE